MENLKVKHSSLLERKTPDFNSMRLRELNHAWDDAVNLILLHELISKYKSCVRVLQVANLRADLLEVIFDDQCHAAKAAKEYSSFCLFI